MDNEEHILPDAIQADFEEATDLIKKAEFGRAKSKLKRLLKEHPREPKILILMGNTYFESGEDFEKAEKYYREALSYDPTYSLALTNLGMLYIHLKRYEEAVDYARKAILRHPQDPKSWIILGLYYVFKGQLETALGYLLAAYSHDNRYAIAAYNAACVLIELDRYEEALDYLDMSLADGEFYKDALEDPSLDSIRDLAEFKRIMSKSKKRAGDSK